MAGRPVSNKRIQQMGYIEGNTVRKLEPERIPEQPVRRRDPRKKLYHPEKPGEGALRMNLPYLVMFMVAALLYAVYLCQLHSRPVGYDSPYGFY